MLLLRSRLAAVAVIAAVSVPLVGCSTHEDPDGEPAKGDAIDLPEEHEGTLVVPLREPFTDGLEFLRLVDREDPITIVDVGITGASDNLEFLGASVLYQPKGLKQYLDGYPPRIGRPDRVVPAVGAELSSSQTLELFVGLRVTESGVARRAGIFVDCTQNGQTYRSELPGQLILCTADTEVTLDECSDVAGEAE